MIPGAHGVCFDAEDQRARVAETICGTLAAAEAGRLILRYRSLSGTRLAGLAPDGPAHIRIKLHSGATRTVPVTNNLWTSSTG